MLHVHSKKNPHTNTECTRKKKNAQQHFTCIQKKIARQHFTGIQKKKRTPTLHMHLKKNPSILLLLSVTNIVDRDQVCLKRMILECGSLSIPMVIHQDQKFTCA